MNNKPNKSDYDSYFDTYIGLVDTDDILEYLNKQGTDVIAMLRALPAKKHDFAYADGKWTVKQLLRHVIDMERIFGYRAMTIARKDKIELPGFDEDRYVATSNDSSNTFDSLIEEYDLLRKSNLMQFKHFTEEMFLEKGRANGTEVSVRAIIFIIAGHLEHHKTILKERYL